MKIEVVCSRHEDGPHAGLHIVSTVDGEVYGGRVPVGTDRRDEVLNILNACEFVVLAFDGTPVVTGYEDDISDQVKDFLRQVHARGKRDPAWLAAQRARARTYVGLAA